MTLKTTNKKEAINYAKKLKETFNEVGFNIDTYKNGECIKNEFGKFINKDEINIYSVVDYTKKKKKKQLVYKISDFFDL